MKNKAIKTLTRFPHSLYQVQPDLCLLTAPFRVRDLFLQHLLSALLPEKEQIPPSSQGIFPQPPSL